MHLLLTAKAGLPEAQYSLGCMFEIGEGVEVNLVKAVEQYQKGIYEFSKYQYAERVSFTSR
jgi:TPR repeat protein